MVALLWPVLLALFGVTMYQICAKETAEDIQPFASLAITYSVAAVLSLILFFLLGENKNLAMEFQKTNWTSWALGFAVLLMELGYIFLYRAGWKISVGSLVANISSAVLLLVIGIFLYKEFLSARQLLGIAVCVAGLVLVNLPGKNEQEGGGT